MDDRISDGRVVLRRYRPDDADALVAACNDEQIQQFISHLPHPYTHDDAMDWIHRASVGVFARGGAAYAVADAGTDELIGAVGLDGVRDGCAEIGYWVSPTARGQGVATAAARALATNAFANGFARLTLRTRKVNTNSQRVALAAGFARESLERGSGVDSDGARHDMVVWARLDTDPDEPVTRALPDLPGHDGAWASGKLTDGVITMRPMIAADAQETFQLRVLPEVVRSSVPATEPTFESVLATCETAEYQWLAGVQATFVIRDTATGSYAGELGLFYQEPQLQQARLGYSIAPAWRRKGYATRAARLVGDWVFANTDVVRLVAGTAPDNTGSQSVLEGAGFQREGFEAKRLPGPDGARIDDCSYVRISPSA
jgi:RimJ/RimL family protein N-acetyltransferase